MSATNSTPIINLPLFIGTDKPAWLTDWNDAMNTIDTAIANLQTAESGTATSLASLAQSVEALSGTVNQHTTAIQTVTTATAGNTGSINTINSLIGKGQPTTEDKTIIGAINEIYAEIGSGSGVAAEDVTYSNTSSGLTATDVQAAIDEVNAKIPAGGAVEADDVVYDNTQSGLTATDVQAAIDELAQGVGGRELIATSTTGTRAQQLMSLATAFSALSTEKKIGAILVADNTAVAQCSDTAGTFIRNLITSTVAFQDVFNLTDGSSYRAHTAGTSYGTIEDNSSSGSITEGSYKLYA